MTLDVPIFGWNPRLSGFGYGNRSETYRAESAESAIGFFQWVQRRRTTGLKDLWGVFKSHRSPTSSSFSLNDAPGRICGARAIRSDEKTGAPLLGSLPYHSHMHAY